jgi:hypothetical protein
LMNKLPTFLQVSQHLAWQVDGPWALHQWTACDTRGDVTDVTDRWVRWSVGRDWD